MGRDGPFSSGKDSRLVEVSVLVRRERIVEKGETLHQDIEEESDKKKDPGRVSARPFLRPVGMQHRLRDPFPAQGSQEEGDADGDEPPMCRRGHGSKNRGEFLEGDKIRQPRNSSLILKKHGPGQGQQACHAEQGTRPIRPCHQIRVSPASYGR